MNRRRHLILAAAVLLALGFLFGALLGFWSKRDSSIETAQATPLSAFPIQRSEIEAAFASVEFQEKESNIVGGLVNHHLLAPDLIARVLTAASEARPKLIVLVSPSHFQFGRAPILTAGKDWKTVYGNVVTDDEIAEKLQARGLVGIDDRPFASEHGIFNILPFIARTFPRVPVLPIIVKDSVPTDEAVGLGNELDAALPSEALIIGSFDFVHGRAETEAVELDQKSLAVLEALDPDRVDEVTNDSRPGLALVMEFARKRGAKRFQLLARDSAAARTGRLDSSENTSYLVGVFISQ